jgi:hypothetical protein
MNMDDVWMVVSLITCFGTARALVWMTIEDMIDEHKSRKERRY